MIPPFDEAGDLSSGLYVATWAEFRSRVTIHAGGPHDQDEEPYGQDVFGPVLPAAEPPSGRGRYTPQDCKESEMKIRRVLRIYEKNGDKIVGWLGDSNWNYQLEASVSIERCQ
jgi:hypothetical protein